jgi:hypothetical protein
VWMTTVTRRHFCWKSWGACGSSRRPLDIPPIAQAVADKVESQDRQHDGYPGVATWGRTRGIVPRSGAFRWVHLGA